MIVGYKEDDQPIKMTSKYNVIVNLFQRGMLSMMVNGMYIRMGGLNK